MNDNLIIYGINRVIYVGKNEYKEKKIFFPAKNLLYHELIYHFSGHTKVCFNQEELYTSPNTIRYLPEGNCERYTVDRLDGEKSIGECIDIFFSSNIPISEKAFLAKVRNEKIATLFKKIFSVWVQKNEGYYLECISLLYKILSEMQKTTYSPDSQFEKIKPAVDYIQNNFLSLEAITAEKLVSLCGISYSYIKRLFATKFKISPKRYIIQLKMNYATDLLQLSEYSISQIANLCGYEDIYSFSRQFKNEFRQSPTDFSKKYKSSK